MKQPPHVLSGEEGREWLLRESGWHADVPLVTVTGCARFSQAAAPTQVRPVFSSGKD